MSGRGERQVVGQVVVESKWQPFLVYAKYYNPKTLTPDGLPLRTKTLKKG